jgi:hypothetical protein
MKESFDMKEKVNPPLARICLGRFSALLVSIVLVFALRPFLEGFVKINILTDIFLSVILLSAIQAVSEKRSSFIIALALAFPYFILEWSTYLVSAPLVRDLAKLFGAFFTAYALIFILSFIVRQEEVTAEVIKAAVCGYFLLGLAWAFVYLFLESLQPGSFQIAKNGTGDHGHFIYFSFVTMTTLGYGDTIPASNAARSLAALEAVMGQLYLAVTIARLVGIHIAQAQQKRN